MNHAARRAAAKHFPALCVLGGSAVNLFAYDTGASPVAKRLAGAVHPTHAPRDQ